MHKTKAISKVIVRVVTFAVVASVMTVLSFAQTRIDINNQTKGTLLRSRGGIGISSTATFPASGTVATTSSVPGAGSCTNQVVSALVNGGTPTCITLTSAYVNNSIAVTGGDINTSSQIVGLHLPTPSTCTSPQFATGIDSSGNAVCATPSGSGNVSNSGTPLIHQLGVWTAATTIKGIAALTNDQVLMGSTGADPSGVSVPLCGDSTHALSYDTATHAWGCQAITAGVTSFNTRTGAVTPSTGDYALGQITATISSPLTLTTNTLACPTCGVTGSPLSQFASTTSAQLRGVISDETGTSGGLVFAGSPTLTTPTLGAATATSINGLSITTTTGGITVANGKTPVFNNSITFAGTDSTTQTFPSTSGTVVSSVTSAGGDLSGTYPSPTVAKVNGNTFPSGVAAHQVAVGTAANTFTLKTLPDCVGSSNALNYTQSTDLFSCLSIATLSNPMTTLGDIIYGGASGAATRLAGPTATNSVPQYLTSTPSGGAATSPTWTPSGVPVNAQTGTTYTVLATDRTSELTFNNASAIAITLPQAGSTGFASKFAFVAKNIGAGAATITPTTSTINGNSTLVLQQGDACFVYSDDTNYNSICSSGQDTVASPITITRSASGNQVGCTTCATTTNGGALTATSPMNISAGGVISATLSGNGSKVQSTSATTSSNGNVVTYDASVNTQDSGIPSANLVTASSNFTSANLVQAAGNNKTTSDSGIPTANVVTASSNYTSGNLVQAAGANKTTSDSGLATANVVTAASNYTSGQFVKAAGNNKTTSSAAIAAADLPAALSSSTSVNGTTIPASATLTQTIANGTASLGTSAISSGACATVVTVSATGVATTDNIMADFNADPTSTTGYSPSSSGMLTIIKYPTANNVNFKVCNNTASSITPGAITLNWRVVR